MKLSDNPFAILGATPRSTRHQLAEKADEAALLGGAKTDDALMILMQMNRRIAAEVSWFPGAAPKAVAAFLSFAKTVSSGLVAPIPPMDGLMSPLAQANALAAFFESWPSSRPEFSIGAFRSLDRVLSKVTTAETLEFINRDRQDGGWEPITDELTLAGPLDDRLREICRLVTDRLEQISSDDDLLNLVNRLFTFSDFDLHGVIARAATDAWSMRIHDREEAMRRQITDHQAALGKTEIAQVDMNYLKTDIEKWCALTAPLRKTAGPVRLAARDICLTTRSLLVRYVNNAKPVEKMVTKTVPAAGGTRTYQIKYQSKKDVFMFAVSLTDWLLEQFPEQVDCVGQLQNDRQGLQLAVAKEDLATKTALDSVK